MNQKKKGPVKPTNDERLVAYKDLERNIVNEISNEFYTKAKGKQEKKR